MKNLLITCFEPFGGENTNASMQAVSLLPETVGEWQLTRLLVPVVFKDCAVPVLEAIRTLNPDAVIMTGQAAGRKAVTPERYAHNLRFARIPDNAGNTLYDEPIADGPDALSSTLDVRRLAQAIRDAGIPSEVSLSAGAYVCNDLYYQVLYTVRGLQSAQDPEQTAAPENEKSSPLPVCFIHVPSVSDGFDAKELSHALEAAILALPSDQSA